MRELQGGAQYATYPTGPTGPLYRRDASGATLRWYIYDGLGSVLGEVDASGNLDATRTYDVYGLARSVTGTPTSKHAWVGQLGHTSEYETGLVYMRARYYDPVVGRFLSEDPARNGSDWFNYGEASPVDGADSSGKEPVWIVHGMEHADEEFIEGLMDAVSEGLDALADFLADNFSTAFSFIYGTDPAIASFNIQIRVLIEQDLVGRLPRMYAWFMLRTCTRA